MFETTSKIKKLNFFLFRFPWYDEINEVQLFPFRTLSMIISAITLVVVSEVTQHLFDTGKLHQKWDFLHCIVNIPEDAQRVDDLHEGDMMMTDTVVKYNATDEMNGRINPALNLGPEMEDETNPLNEKAPTFTTPAGQVKKRLVGEVINPPVVTSPKKQDQTKL